MSEEIRQEAVFFAVSFLTGMFLVILYFILAGLRKLIRHKRLAVEIEDFLYWCVASLVIFAVVFQKNHGQMRLYSVAAFLMGAWIQWKILSFLRRICIKLLKKFKNRGRMT